MTTADTVKASRKSPAPIGIQTCVDEDLFTGVLLIAV
jgi:hypothetical protein